MKTPKQSSQRVRDTETETKREGGKDIKEGGGRGREGYERREGKKEREGRLLPRTAV